MLPASAGAQRTPPPAGAWRFVVDPMAGFHFFGPIRASLSAFVGIGNGDPDAPEVDSRFVLAIAEPGWKGGRISLAYVQWYGLKGGLIGRVSALRFWDRPPEGDYIGAEVQWIIAVQPLGVRVGAFRPASGTGRRLRWLVDLSVMY
jgi:hypothetical protein